MVFHYFWFWVHPFQRGLNLSIRNHIGRLRDFSKKIIFLRKMNTIPVLADPLLPVHRVDRGEDHRLSCSDLNWKVETTAA